MPQPYEIPVNLSLGEAKRQLKEWEEMLKKATDAATVERLNGQIDTLTKKINDTNKAVDQFNLGAKFDDIFGDLQPLSSRLGEIEDRLYELAFAGDTASEEFVALTAEAARMRQTIIDVDKSVDLMGENRGFQRVSTSIGEVGDALLSLDFEGAEKRAMGLQQAINSITPDEVNKQMKALQSTFSVLGKVAGQTILGMVKNVGMLAKTFLSFGASLLANPIFLIAAAVIAIVTAIGLLLNKLGLLKPILEAIGDVFEFIGDILDTIVEGFKMLTDWLGLTDFAAEESAKKQTQAAEKKADAYEKNGKKVIAALDEEIKLNQIQGKSTVELEIKKQQVIQETAKLRLEALRAKMAEAKITGELNDEELKDLREQIEAQRELFQVATREIKFIRAQDAEDRKKEAADAAKEAENNAKEAARKAKEFAQARREAERRARDLELENMQDGIEKEIALNNEKFKRLIEDTKTNEKLKEDERQRIITLLSEQQKINDEKIRVEDQKKRASEAEKEAKEFEALLKESTRKRNEIRQREAQAEAELKALKNQNDLQAQLEFLDLQMQNELNAKELTESEKALIEEKFRIQKAEKEAEFAEKQKAIDEETRQREQAILNESLNAFQGVSDLIFQIKKDRAEKGSAAEEKAARQQFKINKALQVTTATISAIQAVQSVLASPSLVPEPFGTILKVAQATAVGITGAANVAKIAAAKFEGGGGGAAASTGSSAGASATTSASPSVNLFGNANQFNNLQGAQSVEKPKQEITVTAVVAQDEMTQQQIIAKKLEESGTL